MRTPIRGTSAFAADTGPDQAYHADASRYCQIVRGAEPGDPRYRGPRCALTGLPLRDDTIHIVWRDWDARRKLHRGSPIPYGMTTHQTDGGGASTFASRKAGRLGGAEWTPQFSRYMSEVRDELNSHEWVRLSEWWAVEYVVKALRRKLGDTAVDAVLRVTFRRDEYADIADSYRVSMGWIARHERTVYAEARKLLFGKREAVASSAPTESEGPMAPGEVA